MEIHTASEVKALRAQVTRLEAKLEAVRVEEDKLKKGIGYIKKTSSGFLVEGLLAHTAHVKGILESGR